MDARGQLLYLAISTEEGTPLGLWVLEPEDKAAIFTKYTIQIRLPTRRIQ